MATRRATRRAAGTALKPDPNRAWLPSSPSYPVIPYDGMIGVADVLMWWLRMPAAIARIHLYADDYVPVPQTELPNLTESIAGGLAGIVLPPAVNQGIDSTGKDVWVWPMITWTATGTNLPAVLYGYWIDFVDPLTGGTRVLQAQRFQTPQGISAAGQTIKLTPSLGVNQCGP